MLQLIPTALPWAIMLQPFGLKTYASDRLACPGIEGKIDDFVLARALRAFEPPCVR